MDIYLDNASTTFPKPDIVIKSITDYLTNVGGNSNRSNHSNALQSNRLLLEARENMCRLFKFDKPENVVFTSGITMSLNILINGLLKSGDHVITSSMEHNSVLRPLINLHNNNIIELDIVNANIEGFINPLDIKNSIKNNTKLIIITSCSNVTGSIQPLRSIGNICKENNIFFIIDSAQGAGSMDLNFDALNCSAIAFTGHKGLLGPQGIGGFIISDDLNNKCSSTILGGTGSLSHSLTQPDFLPDKFESGTLNMPGIVGLSSSVNYLLNTGIDYIKNNIKEKHLRLLNGINNMSNYIVYGDASGLESSSVISINHKTLDSSELSFILEEAGIKNRAGLHCAPLAHKTVGSFPSGTVRLSVGYFNTMTEIEYTLNILNTI